MVMRIIPTGLGKNQQMQNNTILCVYIVLELLSTCSLLPRIWMFHRCVHHKMILELLFVILICYCDVICLISNIFRNVLALYDDSDMSPRLLVEFSTTLSSQSSILLATCIARIAHFSIINPEFQLIRTYKQYLLFCFGLPTIFAILYHPFYITVEQFNKPSVETLIQVRCAMHLALLLSSQIFCYLVYAQLFQYTTTIVFWVLLYLLKGKVINGISHQKTKTNDPENLPSSFQTIRGLQLCNQYINQTIIKESLYQLSQLIQPNSGFANVMAYFPQLFYSLMGLLDSLAYGRCMQEMYIKEHFESDHMVSLIDNRETLFSENVDPFELQRSMGNSSSQFRSFPSSLKFGDRSR